MSTLPPQAISTPQRAESSDSGYLSSQDSKLLLSATESEYSYSILIHRHNICNVICMFPFTYKQYDYISIHLYIPHCHGIRQHFY